MADRAPSDVLFATEAVREKGGAKSGLTPTLGVVSTDQLQRASDATRAQVARICAGPEGERMRASQCRQHPNRGDDDIESAFQQAAVQAMVGCRAEDEDRVYVYMWRAMQGILSEEGRSRAREIPAPAHASVFEVADGESDPQAALEAQENERELQGLFDLLARKLGPRQRTVLALHVRGVERRTLAEQLGVSERIVKRDLERTLERARGLLVTRCGGQCERGTKLVSRLAFGLANGNEAAQAQLHLSTCASCQTFLGRLGWWREAAAAAIPVPATHQLDPGLAERIVHKTIDAVTQAKQQLVDTGSQAKRQLGDAGAQAKQQLIDAGAQAKQHAAASYTRAVEYTPLASVRPGAAAAAIAGCVAISGGAAGYCVDRGVDPVSGLVEAIHQPSPPEREPVAKQPPGPPPEAKQPPGPPPVPAAPAPEPPPEPTPAAPTPAPQPPATPAPAPAAPPPPEPPLERTPEAVQFGEPTNPAPVAPAQNAPAKPAPAPPSGGTDLYGP